MYNPAAKVLGGPALGKTLTEAEARAQKRQLELLSEDCKRACTTDLNRPFTTLQDAVDRLLPFHVRFVLQGPS